MGDELQADDDIGAAERKRLRALRDTRLLDTLPEDVYDRFTRLAANVLDTPIALISLVDETRQWFKSRVGLDATETPREHAFCAHTIQSADVMVVSDALKDSRFATNPLVCGEPNIRFYAGAPLVMRDGARLGTLCVIDRVPRELDATQCQILVDLGVAVVDQIELRRLVDENRDQLDLLNMAEQIAGVGHWRLDVPTGDIFWSEHVYRIHGRDPQTFTPVLENGVEAYHPDDRAKVSAALDEALATRGAFDFSLRLIRADGATRVVHSRGRCSDDGATVVGIFQDVTQQRELEARLSHAERMASVGTLAAGVAHEVNNPLSYMKANADLLAEEIAEMAGASPSARLRELAERVDEIRDGTRRIHDIVKGLKTFARSGTHRQEGVDLVRVLDVAIRLSNHELRHRAQLVRDLHADTPLVLGDESQLVQVAVNLVVNAAQAIPDGYQAENFVRVACGRSADGAAFFVVQDSGRGMDKDVLRRAFTPFFTTKRADVGTGLGLAISHGIITAHGGTIAAESTPGEGTCIRVVLPAAPPVDADAPPSSHDGAPGSAPTRLSVLVVDDDRLVGQSIARLLGNHDVTTLESAADALEALAGGAHFDVLVCDLMMPNMSGRDLHAALRERQHSMADRMVFVTGDSFSMSGRSFADEAGLCVLDKPVDVDELRRTILEVAALASA